jgi:hypothetical protein
VEYTIEYKQIIKSNPAKVALTVKSEDQILLIDQIDLSKEDKREKFIETLIKKYQGLESEKEKITSRLLEITNELLSDNEENEQEQQIETPLKKSEKALEDTEDELIELAEKFLNEI